MEKLMTALEKKALENGGEKSPLLTDPVCFAINTAMPRTLDLQTMQDLSPQDFLVVTYLICIGTLPEEATVKRFTEGADGKTAFAYRSGVLKSILELPDVRRRNIRILNNIYLAENGTAGKKSLKSRVLSAGYGLGRMLPLSWKIKLKKLLLKRALK